METWYKTTHKNTMREVEVIKATEHFVYTTEYRDGRRTARLSSYECYFPTKREAVEHIMQRAQSAKDRAESEIKRARDTIMQSETIIKDCQTVLENITD